MEWMRWRIVGMRYASMGDDDDQEGVYIASSIPIY